MPVELPCPALFVTGTDTGVGKTYIAAALARLLSDMGLRVGVMKPVESGVDHPEKPGRDAELLTWAASSTDPAEAIAPYRLKAALAPAQAATMEKVNIDPAVIEEKLVSLAVGKDFVIVEGAGGLMVPLRGGLLMADLISQLGVPIMVVARTGLGTLNHTLLTTFTAQSMNITVAGIMLNGMPKDPDQASEGAPKQLAMIASADLLGVMPTVVGTDQECIQKLAEELGHMQTLGWLLKAVGLGQMSGKLNR